MPLVAYHYLVTKSLQRHHLRYALYPIR